MRTFGPDSRRRRGYGLLELTVATLLLAIAMTIVAQTAGWLSVERRGAERRQRALQAAANLMERLGSRPWDELTPELARSETLSAATKAVLRDGMLDVAIVPEAGDRPAKRITIRVQWGDRSAGLVAPVKLVGVGPPPGWGRGQAVSPNQCRRGGWSLLELLAVLAGATALLTLAAGLIFQMLKIGNAERSRVVAASSMERLGHDLRADAHSATKLDELGPGRLLLSLPEGRTVEYNVRGREVVRSSRRGKKVDHREGYGLPPATGVRFESARR